MKLTIEIWQASFYPYRVESSFAMSDFHPDDFSPIFKELKRIYDNIKRMELKSKEKK